MKGNVSSAAMEKEFEVLRGEKAKIIEKKNNVGIISEKLWS